MSHRLHVVLRVFLAAVFALASVTKLRDMAGFRASLASFGIPRRMTFALSRGLPLFEGAIALLLLPRSTAFAAARGALVLVSAFTILIGGHLALGRRPSCHCFGQFSSGPIDKMTLLRNAVMAGIALSIDNELTQSSAARSVGWLRSRRSWRHVPAFVGATILLVQTGVVLRLLRQYGELLKRMDGIGDMPEPPAESNSPPVGTLVPDLDLHDVMGNVVSLRSVLSPTAPTVAMFVSSDCSTCVELVGDFRRWTNLDLGVKIVVVTPEVGSRSYFEAVGVRALYVSRGGPVHKRLGVNWYPSAIAFDEQGRTLSEAVVGPEKIRNLVETYGHG